MPDAFSPNLSTLGKIPRRWQSRPAWALISRREETGQPEGRLLSVYREHGVVPKDSRSDNYNKPSDDLNSYKVVQRGDLVLNKMKTWQGSLAVSSYDGIVSPAYYVCKLSPELHPRFAHHLLRSEPYIQLYRALSGGVRPNQWDLAFEDFRALPIHYPTMDEQARIANFLDREMGRVESIEESRRQYRRLLDERLSESLTDLLLTNTTATNDARIKYLFRSRQTGLWGADPLGDENDLTCVRVADFNRESFRTLTEFPTVRNMAPPVGEKRILVQGDVLLEKSGGGDQAPVGFPATYEGQVRAVCSNFVAALKPEREVFPRYVCLMLAALYRSGYTGRHVKRTTGIQNLDSDSFFAGKVLVHNYSHQVQLAEELDKELTLCSALRSTTDTHEQSLSERSRAVVTAAVTGQINVTTARRIET